MRSSKKIHNVHVLDVEDLENISSFIGDVISSRKPILTLEKRLAKHLVSKINEHIKGGPMYEGILEKISARKKKHPVSEKQRRWAFAAEERGELPKGKALAWSRRVEGEKLPEKTSELMETIALNAFYDELEKLGILNNE